MGEIEVLVNSLHRKLLSATSDAAGKHFQGLRQAARYFGKTLSSRSHRHITNIDITFSILRHLTRASCEECLQSVLMELGAVQEVGAFTTNDDVSESTGEHVVSERSTTVDNCSSGADLDNEPIVVIEPETFFGIVVTNAEVQTESNVMGDDAVLVNVPDSFIDSSLGFNFVNIMQAINNINVQPSPCAPREIGRENPP